jgi:hypothetical protein
MDPNWHKSSYSVANSACVEVAVAEDAGHVMMRDSKDPTGAMLVYDRDVWLGFIDDIRAGRLRRPTRR